MNSDYEQILVAVDGSEASEKAFQRAVTMVKHHHARMILAHVIDAKTFATAEAYDRTLAKRSETNARNLVDRYAENARAAGITHLEQCIEFGSPQVKIAKDLAETFNADLIICGATGVGAVERLLIGSVSENITRYAACDVLVVR